MKTDEQNGQEQYDEWDSPIFGTTSLYHYQSPSGKTFMCSDVSLNEARHKRDAWLEKDK